MNSFKIGELMQIKGRPDKAGIIASIDNGGRCGHAVLRFIAGTACGRSYSLAALEPVRREQKHQRIRDIVAYSQIIHK